MKGDKKFRTSVEMVDGSLISVLEYSLRFLRNLVTSKILKLKVRKIVEKGDENGFKI